ncbi:hypothetical protein [Bradyrhizobium sp. Leo121]|uniref:hypothetical protein n=1 Tax=Bradyrhizobium sp. Leo121 TaxID=1571195 RepID=UPI001029BD6C|nr:hypothetical protein [Bradyrhizobium sp. Leo121]RZN21462.1 hypothetical protein CWO90_33460 [Bradyrhizobium sp. Leo121]
MGAGGFRAAGFRGGFYRPGFGYRSGWGYRRGFPFAAAAVGVGLGYGLYGDWPYNSYDYGDPYYGYYDNSGYGGCYVAQQRVLTSYGWRIRSVDVCD